MTLTLSAATQLQYKSILTSKNKPIFMAPLAIVTLRLSVQVLCIGRSIWFLLRVGRTLTQVFLVCGGLFLPQFLLQSAKQSFRLSRVFDDEASRGEVVDRAERYGDHGTCQTDDIIRHAEIRGRQTHQQGFRVDA